MTLEHCQLILDDVTIFRHLAVESTFLYYLHHGVDSVIKSSLQGNHREKIFGTNKFELKFYCRDNKGKRNHSWKFGCCPLTCCCCPKFTTIKLWSNQSQLSKHPAVIGCCSMVSPRNLIHLDRAYTGPHDIVYNTSKTVCMLVWPKQSQGLLPSMTRVMLGNEEHSFVEEFRYHGHDCRLSRW